MKLVTLNSILLGVVLVATTGCGGNRDNPGTQADTGTIRLEVVLGSNNSLNSIHWQLTCAPTPAAISSGDWDTSHSSTVSGIIGGVPAGDTCTLVLTGTDTAGQNAGLTNNCKGMVANVSAGVTAAVSIVCTDSLTPVAPGTTGSIGVSATVATVQGTHACAGIAAYSASPAEVYVGSSIALGASTTALSDGATATTSWSSPTDTSFSVTGATATYTCQSPGTKTIALRVQDSFVGCPASTTNFNVTCTTSPGGTPHSVEEIINAYVASNPAYDCTLTCATSCSQLVSSDPSYLALVQCIMPPGGYHANGSCYDYAGTNTAVTCYCGATDTFTCTTTGGIGQCAAQETAAGMAPGNVLTGFTDTSIRAGKANAFVNCLSNNCGCFW